jgi:beta-barrel assembly-enhancing protease
LTAYLKSITDPLVEAENTDRHEFQFAIVDDPSVNAFALPGGFVTVNLGLLEKAETGEEIAGVLAHELAHVTLRHGTRRVLRQLGTFMLVNLVFGGTDIHLTAAVLTEVANTAYGRDEESDADRAGIATLRTAGVDPLGMPRFFERIAKDPINLALPTLLSTHPDPGDRAEITRQLAAGANVSRSLAPPKGLSCR